MSDSPQPAIDSRTSGPRRGLGWPAGLSVRLLLLTAAFAIAVEALIIVPAAAGFHERWLLDRVRAAEMASVVVEQLPYNLVDDRAANQALEIGGVTAVALQEQGIRRLLLQGPPMRRTPDFIDLRRGNVWARVIEPWRTLFGASDRMIRVTARPRFRDADFVEVVAPARALKTELRRYLVQILVTSLIVSAIAGALLYLGLTLLVLRPMQRVTASIERFRADPEAMSDLPRRHERADEIGRVEAELDRMQDEVRQALRSRARLAALGEAVAKINHDLRNMLTSARIASDALAESELASDPTVARALPRLERALDRALSLARNVLDYGKSSEPAPEPRAVSLFEAARAAGEDAGLTGTGVRLALALPGQVEVQADPDQLHRILVNLMRNARQAIEAEGDRRGKVTVTSEDVPGWTVVRIADDGPGVPERVKERLFLPFAGSGRPEGAGLGLAIARELAQGHGGDLGLVKSDGTGATFELRLPAPSVAT